MSDVTRILSNIEQGDPEASAALLPLVYGQLRKLAFRELKGGATGNTLQPTALVHEAYVRLVDQEKEPQWNHRGHFYAAAAESMRRIVSDIAHFLQARPGNRPNRVRFRYVPSSSYRFLQTRSHPRNPCESDSIPHELGLVGDKHRRGLPASLGKQKSPPVFIDGLFDSRLVVAVTGIRQGRIDRDSLPCSRQPQSH